MKLCEQLEGALHIRINSNSDIIPSIKKLTELGKLDKPKEIAMFAIILDRLGDMEDEEMASQSLRGLIDIPSTSQPDLTATSSDIPEITISDFTPENIERVVSPPIPTVTPDSTSTS